MHQDFHDTIPTQPGALWSPRRHAGAFGPQAAEAATDIGAEQQQPSRRGLGGLVVVVLATLAAAGLYVAFVPK